MLVHASIPEINGYAQKRNVLYQQANENAMVKQELDRLDDSAHVYKLVGPVLMKQELQEAKHSITARLEFIQKDM